MRNSGECPGNQFLVGLDDELLLDKGDLAKALDVSVKTIDRMVLRKQLPPPAKLGKNVWLVGRIRKWLHRRMEYRESAAWAVLEKMPSS